MQEYALYLRNLQANIAYVATVSSKGKMIKNPTLPGPAVMEPPPGASREIAEKYTKLKELFPGWKGLTVDKMGGPNRQRSSSGMSGMSAGAGPGAAGPMGMSMGMGGQQAMQGQQQRQIPGGAMGGGAFGQLGQPSAAEAQPGMQSQQQMPQGMGMSMGMGMGMGAPQTMNPAAMQMGGVGQMSAPG